MMVAAVVGRRQLALRVDGAAEFAAPDDQRVVEHAALLEILHQAPAALIDVAALARQHLGQVGVDVPAAMIDLHEAHAALDQPARHQAGVGERAALARVLAVELVGGSRSPSTGRSAPAPTLACGTPSRTARCAPAFRGRRASRTASDSARRAPSSILRRTSADTPSGLLM